MALHPYAAHVRNASAAGPHAVGARRRPAARALPEPRRPAAARGRRLDGPAVRVGRALPRPRAILIVSAHWESAPLALSSQPAGTPLVYDFAGFDPVYYVALPDPGRLRARRARRRRAARRHRPGAAHRRGLDHGAWVPLLAMYPEADVPVLQLSIPTHGPADLVDLGERLRPLREQGVLVIGSGFMTHGLPFSTGRGPRRSRAGRGTSTPGPPRPWRAATSTSSRRSARRAPGMPYAHPTVEHFIPMFLTLGAATDPAAPAGDDDRRLDVRPVEAVAPGRLRPSVASYVPPGVFNDTKGREIGFVCVLG